MSYRKLKVGRIKYVNVDPVYWLFDEGRMPEWVEIVEADPTTLNNMMIDGTLDVGPVSSVAYAIHSDKWDLLPGLCISCAGRAMSVILASKGPLEQLHNAPLYLSNESTTSVQLLKLIMERENLSPEYRPWLSGQQTRLPDDAMGGLLIGDRALAWIYYQKCPLFLDLGEYWYAWTGLPFVFAVWVTRKDVIPNLDRYLNKLDDLFNESLNCGLASIESLVTRVAGNLKLPSAMIRAYFEALNYRLGTEERQGMEYFFKLLHSRGMI